MYFLWFELTKNKKIKTSNILIEIYFALKSKIIILIQTTKFEYDDKTNILYG